MPKRPKDDPVTLEIAAKLRALRLANNISQADIGVIAGVSFQQVQKYEKGDNRIPVDRLTKIADGLGVPITYFFEAAPWAETPVQSTINTFYADPMGFRMAQAFNRLPVKSRRAAVEFFEGVAGIQQQAE